MIVLSKDKAIFERIFHASLSNNGSTSSCNLTTLSVATSWIEAKKARHFCDLPVQLRLFPGNLSSFLSLVNWKWNFGTRVRLAISSHRNEASLRNYIGCPSNEELRACSDILSGALSGRPHQSEQPSFTALSSRAIFIHFSCKFVCRLVIKQTHWEVCFLIVMQKNLRVLWATIRRDFIEHFTFRQKC